MKFDLEHGKYERKSIKVYTCELRAMDKKLLPITLKASFHSGKLSVDWNGQENFSLFCELWVGTNDFSIKKNVLSGN